ncbi:MAG: nicotinamide-nucleotide amidohydrolase family protein [Planctomycetota bacterium]
MTSDLPTAAKRLFDGLISRGETLVLAESCTGGRAAAALVELPGASEVLAGSFVTYQTASKAGWLGLSEALLSKHGPVSSQAAAAMAAGAAVRTPQATVAAAISGHLGPAAPEDENGRLLIAVRAMHRPPVVLEQHLDDTPVERADRVAAAAAILLSTITETLDRDRRH